MTTVLPCVCISLCEFLFTFSKSFRVCPSRYFGRNRCRRMRFA